MKIFVPLFCFSILCCCSSGCSSQSGGSSSKKGDFSEYTIGEFVQERSDYVDTPHSYSSGEKGISFKYPDNWKIVETCPGAIVTLEGPTENVGMTVTQANYVKGVEKVSYESFVIENNKKTQASTSYNAFDKGTLNGYHCLNVDFTIYLIPPPDQVSAIEIDNQMYTIFDTENSKVYSVVFDGLKEEFSYCPVQIASILKSIRVGE